MSDLKPCPFCGGEAVATPSAVCRERLHVHCKDHTCPGWSVSRCQPAWWNYRAELPQFHPSVEPLYRDLTSALTHPFDWMGLLHKPPFWRLGWLKAHAKVEQIFALHGFILTKQVADLYHQQRPDDWEFAFTDAGGKICTKLSRALNGQIEP